MYKNHENWKNTKTSSPSYTVYERLKGEISKLQHAKPMISKQVHLSYTHIKLKVEFDKQGPGIVSKTVMS